MPIETSFLPFISFNELNQLMRASLSKNVKKHWSIIESSKRLNMIFPSKAHNGTQKTKSLRNILVHAKLDPDPNGRLGSQSLNLRVS